jgi:hypothetical protein
LDNQTEDSETSVTILGSGTLAADHPRGSSGR